MTLSPSDLDALALLVGKMTEGEWEIWDSCSWRRIGRVGRQGDRPVLEPCIDRSDGHPDLTGPNRERDLSGLVALRNAAPELIEMAKRAAELEERERIMDTTFIRAHGEVEERNQRITDIQAQNAKLRELGKMLVAELTDSGDTTLTTCWACQVPVRTIALGAIVHTEGCPVAAFERFIKETSK